MHLLEAIIMAVSLCADCFAVTLCSSVKLKKLEWRKVAVVAAVFAVIQSGLLMAGWGTGAVFSAIVAKESKIIAFCLLMYVSFGMLREGVSSLKNGTEEIHDLNGFRNIVLGGVATSMDALAVGASMSLQEATSTWHGVSALFFSVMVVTALSVVAGMAGGKALGGRFGHWSVLAGGVVLFILALLIPFR